MLNLVIVEMMSCKVDIVQGLVVGLRVAQDKFMVSTLKLLDCTAGCRCLDL